MGRDLQALAAHLSAARQRRFSFNTDDPTGQDCFRFMAAGVLAQGGPDLLATIEGRWTTELGAARIIRRNGGTLARLMDLRLSRIDPDRAAPGDPCGLVDETRGLVLGLVGTGLLVFAAQPSGVEYRERWTATHAWSF